MAQVVAEAVVLRLQVSHGLHIGHLLGSIDPARGDRHGDGNSRLLGGPFDRRGSAKDDQIREGDALAASLGTIELSLNARQLGEPFGRCVSLHQALAKASANSSGCTRKRLEIL